MTDIEHHVILCARLLVPFLEEGWDEQDAPEDQEAAQKAVDRLIDAVKALPDAGKGSG